jgi:hypothetical protein
MSCPGPPILPLHMSVSQPLLPLLISILVVEPVVVHISHSFHMHTNNITLNINLHNIYNIEYYSDETDNI